MLTNDPTFLALLSILINHINVHGKCNDEVVCKEIAEYLHKHAPYGYGQALFEFIHEYGESEDYSYLGRDSEGEKHYHTHNPDTHWHARITNELVKLGHYNTRNEPIFTLA